MMPPEMCAIPDVMTVMSSDCVISGRYGRIVSGASVCPMKMLAATLSDSAPLALHHAVHHHREEAHHHLHDAEVVEDGEQRRDEDDRRQHLKREDDGVLRAFRPERAGHRARPDAAVAQRTEHERRADAGKAEQLVDAGAERLEHPLADRGLEHDEREDHLQAEPPGHRRQLIARRLFENATAIARMTTAPNSGCRIPIISGPLRRSSASARAARRQW